MEFSIDSTTVDFDGSNPASGVPNSHSYILNAPSDKRILWSYVTGEANAAHPFSKSNLGPRSYSLDTSHRIHRVSYILPNTAGVRAVVTMFYSIDD